jgi:hypothetical protein
MLKSVRNDDQIASVKCLDRLTDESDKFSHLILAYSGVELLIDILRTNCILNGDETIAKKQLSLTYTTLSVLCNISDSNRIKERLSTIKDVSIILYRLLNSKMVDIKSRAAILIADIGCISTENCDLFADVGCLEALIKLLESDCEDLLVNSINCIDVLCQNNQKNQQTCASIGVFLYFVDLLNLNSGIFKILEHSKYYFSSFVILNILVCLRYLKNL